MGAWRRALQVSPPTRVFVKKSLDRISHKRLAVRLNAALTT